MGKRESHVDQCLQEHDKIEQEVVEAIKLRKEGGDKLSNAVDAVFNNFEAHMRHEEDQYVVALLNKVSESDLADVAISFMKAKEEAPLDPQPLSA